MEKMTAIFTLIVFLPLILFAVPMISDELADTISTTVLGKDTSDSENVDDTTTTDSKTDTDKNTTEDTDSTNVDKDGDLSKDSTELSKSFTDWLMGKSDDDGKELINGE